MKNVLLKKPSGKQLNLFFQTNNIQGKKTLIEENEIVLSDEDTVQVLNTFFFKHYN